MENIVDKELCIQGRSCPTYNVEDIVEGTERDGKSVYIDSSLQEEIMIR
jgi:hypothetical protein